ncbi:MAG: hypothetical protein IRZ31_18535 [Thermogemmatispora sp.]|uniref:hypothetical protein n=1 Tax=Thermogemmatispora sp. TaxID=1968838 RepID=UPI00260B0DF5|nr:hypothetical protein [Thermogemmatispora sp.]MBX5458895.1 hypothetical protein [Thermogemmatispora sp.]
MMQRRGCLAIAIAVHVPFRRQGFKKVTPASAGDVSICVRSLRSVGSLLGQVAAARLSNGA